VIPIIRLEDLKLYDWTSCYLITHGILKRLLEEEMRKEYRASLQGLVRYKPYFYRAEAQGFRNLIGELIEKRLPRQDSRTFSAISRVSITIASRLVPSERGGDLIFDPSDL
jgi:hypothetical protein